MSCVIFPLPLCSSRCGHSDHLYPDIPGTVQLQGLCICYSLAWNTFSLLSAQLIPYFLQAEMLASPCCIPKNLFKIKNHLPQYPNLLNSLLPFLFPIVFITYYIIYDLGLHISLWSFYCIYCEPSLLEYRLQGNDLHYVFFLVDILQ